MSQSTLWPMLVVVLVAGAGACRGTKAQPPEAATASDPKAIVAKLDADVITEGELADATRAQLATVEAEHAERVYSVRKVALDRLIEKRLIAQKAKAAGLTAEQLIDRDVNAKIAPPTEAKIQAVYEEGKQGGRELPPLAEIRGDIVRYLNEQEGGPVRKAFIDQLRAGVDIQTLLAPPQYPKVAVNATGPSKGNAKAPVTIVEFSDFECPYCIQAEETVERVLAEYPDKVRLVYRDYPLPFHHKAIKASEAAHCADEQGKYWAMHGKLFSSQALAVTELKEHARELGLDGAKFDKCLDSGAKAKVIEASKKAGEEAGVSGTPAFFINGRMISGAQPYERFKQIIDNELTLALR
jgi:protein-disulfide isomerase